jgi:hypothetical protein
MDPYIRQLTANAFGNQGMILDYNTAFSMQLGYNTNVAGSSAFSLNSAYTFGSAGASAGYRFIAPADDYLTDVYLSTTGKTGSPGNLTFEMRNQNNATTPGSTVYANTPTVAAVNAFNWLRWTLATPQPVTRNTVYWICVGDPAGAAGTFQALALRAGPTGNPACSVQAFSSTNGWTTGTISSSTISALIVLKYASGRVQGNPIQGIGALGITTIRRGLRFFNITNPIAVDGMAVQGQWGSNDSAQIFIGDAKPLSTPAVDEPAGSSIGTSAGGQVVFFKRPFIMRPGLNYRAVVNAVSSNSPGGQLGANAGANFPDVLKCGQMAFNPMSGLPNIVGTSSSGNAWVDNSVNMYTVSLLVRDLRMR